MFIDRQLSDYWVLFRRKTVSYVQTVPVHLSVTLSWIISQNYKQHLHWRLARGRVVRQP